MKFSVYLIIDVYVNHYIYASISCASSGRFQPGSLANGDVPSSSSGSEIENLKQELLSEMRKELQKIKDEIVQGNLLKATRSFFKPFYLYRRMF